MQAAPSQTGMLQVQLNGRHTPCWVSWRRKAILSASRHQWAQDTSNTAAGKMRGWTLVSLADIWPSGFLLSMKEVAQASSVTVKSEILICLEFRHMQDTWNKENRQKLAKMLDPSSYNYSLKSVRYKRDIKDSEKVNQYGPVLNYVCSGENPERPRHRSQAWL